MLAPLKTRVKLSGTDRVFTLYSIGWLCRMVNKSALTVRKWERDGILPRPLFLDKTGDLRWYSAPELFGYSYLVSKFKLQRGVNIKNTGFPKAAADYHGALRHLFAESPDSPRLVEALPQEKQLYAEIMKQRRSRREEMDTAQWMVDVLATDPQLREVFRIMRN